MTTTTTVDPFAGDAAIVMWSGTMRAEDICDGYVASLDLMRDAGRMTGDEAGAMKVFLRDALADAKRTDHWIQWEIWHMTVDDAADAIRDALPLDWDFGCNECDPAEGGFWPIAECVEARS